MNKLLFAIIIIFTYTVIFTVIAFFILSLWILFSLFKFSRISKYMRKHGYEQEKILIYEDKYRRYYKTKYIKDGISIDSDDLYQLSYKDIKYFY